jgi:hypothetical protein
MTPAHLPALRWALCGMLADTRYSEVWKDRAEVEQRLGEAAWPEMVCMQLKALALRWISTQRRDVQVAMRQALGEAVHEVDEAVLLRQTRRRSTHSTRTTTLGGVAMATIAERIPQHKHTIVRPEDGPVSELYGELDWTELERQARLMQGPPWEQPQARLAQAVAAIKAGRVSLGVPATSLAYVVSNRDAKRKYTVRETGCSCQATHPCYHQTAAELYRLWQSKLEAPSLFPAPKSAEERLADSPGLPTTASDSQNNAEHASASETPLEAPGGQKEGMPLATAPSEEETPAPALPRLPVLPQGLGLRSITAIVADLSKPLPKECIPTIAQGSEAIPYLHWQHVRRLLDTYAPGWHGSVMRMDQVGKSWALTYRLTIPCLEGDVCREATGQENLDLRGYGDVTSNAEAMAFKRAAAKFGVGAWLYDKEDDPSGPALDAHLHKEKTQAVIELGQALVAKGLDRRQAFTWLKTQAGVTTLDHLPLAAIRTMLAYVAQHEDEE